MCSFRVENEQLDNADSEFFDAKNLRLHVPIGLVYFRTALILLVIFDIYLRIDCYVGCYGAFHQFEFKQLVIWFSLDCAAVDMYTAYNS